MIKIIFIALFGYAVGFLSKAPPDPPEIERQEIIDRFRAILAEEETSEAERRFSLREIIKILYSIEG